MEIAKYFVNNNIYNINKIIDVIEIDKDLEEVLDAITDTPLDKYKENMIKSVQQELAFSIYKDNIKIGFVYNYMEDFKYIGASMYIHTDIIATLLAFKTIFDINDTHKLSFIPHQDGIKYFKSIVLGDSIRAYHKIGSPVVVLRSTIYEKGFKMFKYLGIKKWDQ